MICFKRGTTDEMVKSGHVVHCFSQVLLNVDTWELFIADGKKPMSELEAVGVLPENMREQYRSFTK
jgi:hypothetical protein